jgi:hypothetical protein
LTEVPDISNEALPVDELVRCHDDALARRLRAL